MSDADSDTSIKGVVLAGGTGTRLLPLTRVTNKHLLPVHDRPMVYFALEAMCTAGAEEVLLITSEKHADDFSTMLGDGREFGLRSLAYAVQQGAGGIADALRLAEDFADNKPIAVMLGDNIFRDSLAPVVSAYRDQLRKNNNRGARVVLKEVEHPEGFGIAELDANAQITNIVEKPAQPTGNLAVTGFYLYDVQVFDIVCTLKPSARGELEITDVNRAYLERRQLEWSPIDGWWTDAGTTESLHRASQLVARDGANGQVPTRPEDAE